MHAWKLQVPDSPSPSIGLAVFVCFICVQINWGYIWGVFFVRGQLKETRCSSSPHAGICVNMTHNKPGHAVLSVDFHSHCAAMQCALCLAAQWPAGVLSVPLQLAPLASLPAVGNINNLCVSSSCSHRGSFPSYRICLGEKPLRPAKRGQFRYDIA